MDSALHILVHPAITGNRDKGRYYLPAKIGTFAIHDTLLQNPFPAKVYTHATFVKWTPGEYHSYAVEVAPNVSLESLVYNFAVVTEAGERLCTITDLEVALHGKTAKVIDTRYELVLQPTERRVKRVHAAQPHGRTSPISDASSDSGYATTEGEKSSTDLNARIVEYVRGRELELQRFFAKVDPLAPLSLWFTAAAGLDGDASLGFSRSIRREYRSWNVHDVVFDGSWSQEERNAAVHQLAVDPHCEDELSVDADGLVSAPRILQSVPPAEKAPFKANEPWVYADGSLKQVSAPHVAEDHVLVNVTGVAQKFGDAWSFVGRVEGKKSPVVGLVIGELSNVVVAHVGSLVDFAPRAGLVPHVFAYAVAGSTLGPAALSNPTRLAKSKVVVTHADTALGSEIVAAYRRFGVQVLTLSEKASLSEVRAAVSQKPTYVVSGAIGSSDNVFLNDLLHSRDFKTFDWLDAHRGLKALLAEDPWSVGDVLRLTLDKYTEYSEVVREPLELIDTPLPAEVPIATDLFNEKKSYLLIGGIGSLGLQIALWMYEVSSK